MYAEQRNGAAPAPQPYLEGLLSHLEWTAATPRLLTIGRNAIQEAAHYVDAYGFSRLQIYAVDLDDGVQPYATTVMGGMSRQWLSIPLEQVAAQLPYHLIWADELFDTIATQQGRRLLGQLLRAVAPGGALVIGSRQSAYHLRTLAAACGVPAAAMSLRRGPDGTKLFLHIQVRHTPGGFAAPVIHLN